MNALLLGYQILTADESPLYPFRNRGKIVIDRAMLNTSTCKEKDCKKKSYVFPRCSIFSKTRTDTGICSGLQVY